MPEGREGSDGTQETEGDDGRLPRGSGSDREFGGGRDGVSGDEQKVARHLLLQFLARAVQGAGQGVVDGAGAVGVAEVDDEVAEGGRGGRWLARGGLGRLTSAAR